MGRSRQLGMFLVIGASIQMLIMLIGTLRRSYLVIALPVLVATGIVSALAFWVGWTMMNTEPELAELEEADAVPAPI
ncbi:MAG: hypothetical protein EPO22_06785 [Dehalococcoidia bacterium]|nr:MAG: hypothetical protein EPO22_06785 [Dehalococcoidia bacterium]